MRTNSSGARPFGPHRSIAILDYGMGNLRSAEKAIQRVGGQVCVTRDAATIRDASGLVLPGVGAFPKAMENVRALGFDELMRDHVAAGKPALGICLGMQLLFDSSSEHGGAEGIGLLEGPVVELEAQGQKIPHIGWNEVSWSRDPRSHAPRAPANGTPLAKGLPQPTAFYHVHSFAPKPARTEHVLGRSTYGGDFASVVGRDGVFGVQFHPEKSGPNGLALLANFVRLVG